MAEAFSGTPFTGDATTEVVIKSPTPPKPTKQPAAKVVSSASVGQQPNQPVHYFTIDNSLIDFLFQKQEELSQKQIVNFDALVAGMKWVASQPLSPNAPDTLWSNFLTQILLQAVRKGSKGVAPR